MSGKDTPQNVIRKFEKRQKSMPYILGGLAALLVVGGILIIVSVVSAGKGGGKPFAGLFASKTPTVTITPTPTATQPSPTPSMTPTETLTATPAATETPSQPYLYTVQQGDDCWTIAYTHNADLLYMRLINLFNDPNNPCPINAGDNIYIPAPGQKMPTPTRVPSDVPRATSYDYIIQEGDTLAIIAEYFSSTVEDILARNPEIKDENAIEIGQVIKVRVNMVTPTPTTRATSTLANPLTPTVSPTAQ